MEAATTVETRPYLVPAEGPEPDVRLVDDLVGYMDKYVELPSAGHSLIQAIWVAHTWCFNVAFVTPYLYVFSKGPGSGKTRNCDVLGTIVRNPDSGTDSPVHVLGQEVAASCPTLFFDEIDTVFAGRANNPLKRFLNIGYRRGAVIKRQRASAVEVWPVFCGKVMAGINNNHLPQSLLSRCIPIEMGKRTRELERFNAFRVQRDPERLDLVDRLARFAEDFEVDVALQRPEPIKMLDDRENEISEPLLQIAIVLGKEAELRKALSDVFGKKGGVQSREKAILSRIKRAFDVQAASGGSPEYMFTEDLLTALGSYYSGRTLGILLDEFGFHRTAPETMRIGNQVKRGYARRDFEPLFDRYLDQETPRLEVVHDDESEDWH